MSVNETVNAAYRSARYVVNAHRLAQLPADTGREVAFAGRSNAGKSSAINTLTGQKGLARTSKTPGRTQQIVVFEIDQERRIADLPGFGFAQVPEKLRRHWRTLLQHYFEGRVSLCGVILLMDIRHPLRPFDVQMVEWCLHNDVPCHVLLTKTDKLGRGPALATLRETRKLLPGGFSAQIFSARTGAGLDELVRQLDTWYGFETAVTDSPGGRHGDRIAAATEGKGR